LKHPELPCSFCRAFANGGDCVKKHRQNQISKIAASSSNDDTKISEEDRVSESLERDYIQVRPQHGLDLRNYAQQAWSATAGEHVGGLIPIEEDAREIFESDTGPSSKRIDTSFYQRSLEPAEADLFPDIFTEGEPFENFDPALLFEDVEPALRTYQPPIIPSLDPNLYSHWITDPNETVCPAPISATTLGLGEVAAELLVSVADQPADRLEKSSGVPDRNVGVDESKSRP
jgi:hypothetical protein